MARIILAGKPAPKPWACEKCGGPGPRARLSTGVWSDFCANCYAEFKGAIDRWKAREALKKGKLPF